MVVVLSYVAVLVAGAINIGWDFYLKSYHKGEANNTVALSFDDGPEGGTLAILDILKAEGVKAAFFWIGRKVTESPEIVKRAYDEGHIIGNHSYEHGFNFDWKSAAKMQEEIEQTNQAIEGIIHRKPVFFRPPYGVTNPNLAKAVKRTGLYSIGWSIRSFDTTADNKEQLLDRVLGKIKGGDIILLHDNRSITADILTDLIRKARERGFTFVPLNELLKLEPYK